MRQRMYRGKDVTQNLLDWLNTATDTAAKRRVLALLDAMQHFRTEQRPRQRARMFLEIADGFARYHPRFGIRWDRETDDWSEYWTPRGDAAEGNAAAALLDLHRDKMDHRLRRCLCGTWFLAR